MKKLLPEVTFRQRQLLSLGILTLFSIQFSNAQNIDFGKSYINITKGLNGGTVETGDTLEIRAAFVVRSGTYDSCRYQDAIPVGTAYINNTLRVLTNEGKIYKSFTDTYGDDQGWRTGLNITIHLGYNTANSPSTTFRRGQIRNTHKPSFYGSACIMIASFRVRVTAATGSNISTGGGNMTYKSGSFAIQTFTFPANILKVYPNYGICSNTIGGNAIGTEFNGTFGSGRPRNRGTSANVPTGYTYNYFDLNSPQDYYYGIANNTSTRQNYTSLNTWAKPDLSSPSHRVFGVWDIIGDHTGAIDPIAGNPAADTAANPNAGYMLIINAAYRIDSAFQQTISSLCPNTYYEISCWMRNICSKCGCDSNGKGASNGSGPTFYIPTGPGDSSGVAPNITFEVDGIDYYTTGNLLYSGQWVKKGFTFLTGPAQTSFTLKYFNNAPGGGGNDWALDDISVATCSPNMRYGPIYNPIVCDSNVIVLSDTVRSFFNNYTQYKWQRSTDGGTIWNDIVGATGNGTPTWNGTAWQYVTLYTVPIAQTQMINNGDMYRVVAATTVANLSNPNCSFTDPLRILLTVISCAPILSVKLISFTGRNANDKAALQWTTTEETESIEYVIERSSNDINFTQISVVSSYNDYSSERNIYLYTDPNQLTSQTFYRIKMISQSGYTTYSRIIQLSPKQEVFTLLSVVNPFNKQLSFEVSSAKTGILTAEILNQTGKVVRKKEFTIVEGVNTLVIDKTDLLANGVYFLRAKSEGTLFQKIILKQNK
ncbi:MAG: T9SS type A sorting domain-containing protein [Chitinophagaceae bacterium]